MSRVRRWSWLGLLALAVVSGCNIPSLSYFLMGGDVPKEPAQWHQLASKDKEKEVQVAILVSNNLEIRDQFARVDRDLCQRIESHLRSYCKQNEEKVTIVPMHKVKHYTETHPGWDNPIDLVKIGRELKVKYVIYLELNKLSLYEPRSNEMFYHGSTDIEITLVNANKGEDDVPDKMEFHREYPSTPIDVSNDTNPLGFRNKFLNHVAKRIAWQFTSHPTNEDYAEND